MAADEASAVNPGSTAADQRERTYSWDDPLILAEAATRMSGLEFLTSYAAENLPRPPALVTAGISPVSFADGSAVFELTPAEWQYNPIGSVHGGILTTLADSALGCCVHTKLARGFGYTSLELKINFTRAVTVKSGRLLCEGRVITIGRRIATCEATIKDQTERVVAHATSTCLIFEHQ
jgi:uncharacterized protein (TIGR00369 family)